MVAGLVLPRLLTLDQQRKAVLPVGVVALLVVTALATHPARRCGPAVARPRRCRWRNDDAGRTDHHECGTRQPPRPRLRRRLHRPRRRASAWHGGRQLARGDHQRQYGHGERRVRRATAHRARAAGRRAARRGRRSSARGRFAGGDRGCLRCAPARGAALREILEAETLSAADVLAEYQTAQETQQKALLAIIVVATAGGVLAVVGGANLAKSMSGRPCRAARSHSRAKSRSSWRRLPTPVRLSVVAAFTAAA